jgi:hypothetical protein
MKQTAVEWLEKELNAIRLDVDKNVLKFIDKSFEIAKGMEKEQQGYSKEEAIAFSKWCAKLKVWDNETYVNNTFETLFEQFKKK